MQLPQLKMEHWLVSISQQILMSPPGKEVMSTYVMIKDMQWHAATFKIVVFLIKNSEIL